MKLKDLKSGQIVQIRNTSTKYSLVVEDRLITKRMECIPLCLYDENMMVKKEHRDDLSSFDIVRVYNMGQFDMKDFATGRYTFKHEPIMSNLMWVREDIELSSEQLKRMINTFNESDWIAKDDSGQLFTFTEEPRKDYMSVFDPINKEYKIKQYYWGEGKSEIYTDLFDGMKSFDSPINIGELLENIHYITKLKEKGIM